MFDCAQAILMAHWAKGLDFIEDPSIKQPITISQRGDDIVPPPQLDVEIYGVTSPVPTIYDDDQDEQRLAEIEAQYMHQLLYL